MPIQLLLVDDQILFVQNLKVVIEATDASLRVAGIAYDGAEAVKKARELRPDVVLMDVRMPKLDGVGATEQIRKQLPTSRIIMLTTFDDDEYVYQALNNGASGYLLKSMLPETLVSSIHAVANGAVLISPSVATNLVRNSHQVATGTHAAPEWLSSLTRRDRSLLCLLLEHLSNRDIADRLCISEGTVRNYISAVYEKLGAENRFHAMRLAESARSFLRCEEFDAGK